MNFLLFMCALLPTFLQVPADKCKSDSSEPIITNGISDSDKQAIVDLHNKYRNQVASGTVLCKDNNSLPSASDMQLMAWDDDLAAAAQRHTVYCKFEHFDPDNPDSTGNLPYGQNIYEDFTSGTASTSWSSAVGAWFNEVKDFPAKSISPYRPATSPPDVGHFTQVVWASSKKVGCGYTQFTSTDPNYSRDRNAGLYTCNYSPAGNMYSDSPSLTFKVYTDGTPCRTCKCDQVYSNLCIN